MKRGITLALFEMVNWCLRNPLEGDPLAADDPGMVALLAYITYERRGGPSSGEALITCPRIKEFRPLFAEKHRLSRIKVCGDTSQDRSQDLTG